MAQHFPAISLIGLNISLFSAGYFPDRYGSFLAIYLKLLTFLLRCAVYSLLPGNFAPAVASRAVAP
ncbi:MAG: hypothetical protein ACREFN_08735 [Acetobacteraceae bacterium]